LHHPIPMKNNTIYIQMVSSHPCHGTSCFHKDPGDARLFPSTVPWTGRIKWRPCCLIIRMLEGTSQSEHQQVPRNGSRIELPSCTYHQKAKQHEPDATGRIQGPELASDNIHFSLRTLLIRSPYPSNTAARSKAFRYIWGCRLTPPSSRSL
jgi:hypothetical protein